MAYLPIEDHGVIGNMYTTALVGLDGTIDWFCFPHHDSPSVFGSVLDDKKGGHFSIAPQQASSGDVKVNYKQLYWPQTNVLVTRFLTPDGVGEVIDFMPVGLEDNQPCYHSLIRQVRVVRGKMTFELSCCPALNYGRDRHQLEFTDTGAQFIGSDLSLGLSAEVKLKAAQGQLEAEAKDRPGVEASFTLETDENAVFILQATEGDGSGSCGLQIEPKQAEGLFEHTVDFWRTWLKQCTYRGRWREQVERSALVLKLMTFEPTGAIIAAPTCSLPEVMGGERNWDYRYTWVRDSAFTLYGLLRIGFTEEAAQFMHWMEQRCNERNEDGSLQIMYGIDGRHELKEEDLDHWEGYRGSSPVHLGNGAYDQLQLDIYGELMDSVYLYDKYGAHISYSFWTRMRSLTNWVCDHWQEKDVGIWEVRGGDQHFLYSKLMCWVALDRALRLAEKRSFPADRDRWLKNRDAIYEEIMEKGWDEERQAFTQAYESKALDASSLIMPLVLFLSPTDPRMLKTLDTTAQSLKDGGLLFNNLVYRYNAEETDDGLSGEEGTFNMCTFWLVEALTRAGKYESDRLDQARLMFEDMLGYANHLGLYAEEIGPSGEALGNFPQAFTHLSLISAAWNLDKALGE